MQLHRLEVEGFGPFRARQVVDFDAFADDGIFLIAGRTGAGKSSILDAVCFGLYGGVPRYEGGEKRLRSDHCEPDDPTEVVVEFSTSAGRYRVTRSPDYERPKKRGGGLTVQPAAVQLDVLVGGEWIGLAAKEREAAHELDGILQLSREQFLQVILLAQNRFSEFLLAGSKDRQALLRRLFGTERFEDVQARFDERRREAERALGSRLATVAARLDEGERIVATGQLGAELGGGTADSTGGPSEPVAPAVTTEKRLARLRQAKARADYRAERRAAERADAEKMSSAADAALSALRDDQRAQVERDRARAALARLDAEEPQIAQARAEWENARAAEILRAPINAATTAEAAAVFARNVESRARTVWEAYDIDAPDLAEWAEERTRQTGAWERASQWELSAPQLDAELVAATEALDALLLHREESEAERRTVPARLEQVTTERDEARRLADRADDLASAERAAATRRAAALEVARLEAELVVADRALADASALLAGAQSTLAQLRQRRLDGFAGELATALREGEACPVCGSIEHPAPAEHADPVSAEDIDRAEAERDRLAERERAAGDAAASLRLEQAAALTKADGRDAEASATEQTRAAEALAQSRSAVERVRQLDEQRDALIERIRRLDDERDADEASLASARETHALLTQRVDETRAAITEARGDFASVAERLAATTAEVAAAHALADAVAERARRDETASIATAERDAAIDESVFDDVASVERALRSPSDQQALEARVSAHSVQREKEREILFDLELRTLPEEPIDLHPAEQESQAARRRWTTAVDEASRATAMAEQLGAAIDAAASEHARTADDAGEYEVLRDLADTIAGRGANTRKMTLETFVLAAELEEIVDAANRRLGDMSTGRYQLRHSDALAARGAASGLGIVVFDAFTGQTRPAQSLSGGETFLSSLALALGLAEVVTARAGGIRLDTLFIDEGFGSLDGDTLEVAMRTLDELRQGGRTVGVISHVEAMQEQIPAQLRVRATSEGPSVIESR
ncbi:AAA family ATPase [Microbacterium foliorum]|uniref:AAA family ATPase n=1 Tax=Microbacterium foliorum TaxID=104336 RepID=UPI001D483285|nr:SMC family ATPase [Microbacterium foliorum]CAH0159900.1 Nuclease SbcCD subunit C [Microbacterium foliorum]CAH0188369.1 Nuclease SbcCD subunit C [Microbacterium foliorum]